MPVNPLIRNEVTDSRRQRLYGDVVLGEAATTSGIALLLIAVSALVIAAVATATYSRTEQVRGVVATETSTVRVIPPRAGVVEEVFVQEGSLVRKGDVLAHIGVDVVGPSRRGIARETLFRLDEQSLSTRRQIEAASRTQLDERSRLSTALGIASRERASLYRQLGLQERIILSKSAELDRLRPVAERGFVSGSEIERRTQALLQERQRLEAMRQQMIQQDRNSADLSAAILHLPVETDRRVAELQGQMATIGQQALRVGAEVGYPLLAPSDGIVTALQIGPGKTVDGRLPALVVVPASSRYQVVLYAPSRAAGLIRRGQHVRISYDAFPYRRFGTHDGIVATISRTTYAAGETDAAIKVDEPVYQIGVKLARTGRGPGLPLRSGMTLTANVVLDRRTFVDWLLQPFDAIGRRS